MKTRTDFVTNSSSSSYIVGFKGEGNLKDALNKITSNLETDHPYGKMLKYLIQDINSCIAGNCNEITKEEFLEDNGYETMDELVEDWYNSEEAERYKFVFEHYPRVFIGYFSNDSDDSIEIMLVDYNIDVHEGDIYIYHEAGY